MKPTRYRAQVRRCTAEIQAALPALASRHTPLILVAALTEHLRGALFLAHEAHACTPGEAQAIIRRIEQIAFKDGCGPVTSTGAVRSLTSRRRNGRQ
jgi:hypothetical protein